MPFSLEEQTIATFKARYGVNHTAMSNAEWFAELFEVRAPTYSSEVWLELQPGTNYYANHDGGTLLDADIVRTRTWNGAAWSSVPSGGVIKVEKIVSPLALLTATNKQAHMSLVTPQASIDPPTVLPSDRLRDYIRFTDFGADFRPRIYWDNGGGTAPGDEITTLALPYGWAWDADAGILLCGADSNEEFVPSGNLPIWIEHYRYIGDKGVSGGGSVAGASQNIEVVFGFGDEGATVSSTTVIPEGARILSSRIEVETVFDGGETAQLFLDGAADVVLLDTTENDLQTLGSYQNREGFLVTAGNTGVISVAVAGAGATTGAGRAWVTYTTPES
jgi:hypothetical protein